MKNLAFIRMEDSTSGVPMIAVVSLARVRVSDPYRVRCLNNASSARDIHD